MNKEMMVGKLTIHPTVVSSLRGLEQQGWERLPDKFSSRNFAKHINILKVLRSPATKRSI